MTVQPTSGSVQPRSADDGTRQPDAVLDARGLACPLPLLKAKQALSRLAPGQLLEVQATDAGSWRDFASFTQQSPHELEARERSGEMYHYWIRKGGDTTP
ncbi:sulfurtransferase TusA family protein [Halomonas sp. Bachu 37]|uniref:sulfurtransferase TusA family protein n=1 Tax=Halomonas kashgarensis TaxID=3084920 RepID=UPI0032171485